MRPLYSSSPQLGCNRCHFGSLGAGSAYGPTCGRNLRPSQQSRLRIITKIRRRNPIRSIGKRLARTRDSLPRCGSQLSVIAVMRPATRCGDAHGQGTAAAPIHRRPALFGARRSRGCSPCGRLGIAWRGIRNRAAPLCAVRRPRRRRD